MKLSLIYKILSIYMALFGIPILFSPSTMIEAFGIGVNANNVKLFTQALGVFFISFALIHWQMPNWMGENLKSTVNTFAGIHGAFLILNIYQMIIGLQPAAMVNIAGFVPIVILIILLYTASD